MRAIGTEQAEADCDDVSAVAPAQVTAPLGLVGARGDPGRALALQRAAGNRATVAALRGARQASTARPMVARDLWGDVSDFIATGWDAVKDAVAAVATADPLAGSFDFAAARTGVEGAARDYAAGRTTARRLALIRALKRIVRLATPSQQGEVRKDLESTLGAADAGVLWAEAGTAFGGYVGMFPGYAPDIKRDLKTLGASDTLSFDTFEVGEHDSGATYRSRARSAAARERSDLARTDIVYFRGHQFAQYRAPGMFSDGAEKRRLDLRYVDEPGGFPNVKLMISTSCATLCREAFDVFHTLFPNAVILGYRKSAPIQGEQVRKALIAQVKAIGRPLLLEESSDIAAVTGAWRKVIEDRHKGDTAQLPGYWDGSTIHYWDGKAWGTVGPADAGNKCKRKGDFSPHFPAP